MAPPLNRIALCYPPSDAVTAMPPLGLGYLAGQTERAGFPTDVYDLARRHLSVRRFAEILRRNAYSVIGLSVSTPNYQRARALAQTIREAAPAATFIIGGPHPSVFSERSLQEFQADYLLPKEADLTLPRFLELRRAGGDPVDRLAGVFAWRDGRLAGRPSEETVDELDALAWPAWDKLEPQRYPLMPHQFFVRRFPVAPILTTRGCPMNCSFCASTYLFGKKVRTRDPSDVVAELEYLRDRFGIREVHFEDDNLTLHRAHALALFQRIIDARLGLLLKCPNGLMTSTLDDELLALLARAGCYQLSLGIETLTPENVDKERKLLPVAEVRETVRRVKRHGIDAQGLFVVGLPYESERQMRAAIRQTTSMGLDLAHFGVFVPLPGSSYGERLAAADFASVNFFTPQATEGTLDTRRLKRLQRYAILRFYLRPRPIWTLLRLFKFGQTLGALRVARRYLLGF